MHISAVDAPSDMYGAVTDVSRPLIYKLNSASMQRSTYDALHTLLIWALAQMETNIASSLLEHEVHQGIVKLETQAYVPFVIPTTESFIEAQTHVEQARSISTPAEPATPPANTSQDEIVPLTVDLLNETAEDAALETEVLTAIAEVPLIAPVQDDAQAAPVAVKKVAKPK